MLYWQNLEGIFPSDRQKSEFELKNIYLLIIIILLYI
jgi:hypothetical protein